MSIDFCIQKAKEIPYRKGQKRHFAAVLDKRGRVVSCGHNSYVKTSPKAFKAAKRVGREHACYLHAEIRALYLDKHRKGVKLVVARVGANGEPMYSEPCCICKEALKDFPNIKSVEYTT